MIVYCLLHASESINVADCVHDNIILQELDDNLAELTRHFEEATSAKVKCQQQAEATATTISLANRCFQSYRQNGI